MGCMWLLKSWNQITHPPFRFQLIFPHCKTATTKNSAAPERHHWKENCSLILKVWSLASNLCCVQQTSLAFSQKFKIVCVLVSLGKDPLESSYPFVQQWVYDTFYPSMCIYQSKYLQYDRIDYLNNICYLTRWAYFVGELSFPPKSYQDWSYDLLWAIQCVCKWLVVLPGRTLIPSDSFFSDIICSSK